ncbi:YbaY family lipoprotein [Thalassoglobus sp. JC818]|uniref:YbaY family lipoprotein n=1 Tax=Thalassoglobus sp. JC818 TaxID=3232136 RepID=UPI003457E9F8
MKRISFAAIVCCLISLYAVDSQAIDRSRTGGSPTQPAPTNIFDPMKLPGQDGLGNLGVSPDPFLPSGIYNPFPTLPGVNPSTTPQGGQNLAVPNPQSYPGTTTPENRMRIQGPTQQYVPPGGSTDPASSRWRLGILSRDTEHGVKIYEVVEGSAAKRAGLEVEDLIVAVQGYQVGIVNGVVYELSKEFERHADQNGMVSMLVQDHRTRSLMNLSVKLDSRFSTIRGSLTLNGTNAGELDRNAIVTVELQEIVRQGAAPLTIARKEISNPRQYPINFELQYDPAQVSTLGEYVLVANLIRNGRASHKTIQSYTVNSQGTGSGRPLAMRLDPVRPTYGDTPVHIDESARVATIVRWFNEYLGRPPSDRELSVWLTALDSGYTLKQVQLELLGHNQFFNRCDRDKEVYVRRVHELLVGQKPNPDQLEYWIGRYDALGGIRRDIASEFQDAVGIR